MPALCPPHLHLLHRVSLLHSSMAASRILHSVAAGLMALSLSLSVCLAWCQLRAPGGIQKRRMGAENRSNNIPGPSRLHHLICLSLLHKDAPRTCPQYSLPTPGAPSPPRIYSVLQARRRGKHPLEPERPKGSLCVYFHLGWLRSGHHRPESGVGKFREWSWEVQGDPRWRRQCVCPPGTPFSLCNLFFSVERLAELGSGWPQGRRPFGE